MNSCYAGGIGNSKHREHFMILLLEVLLPVAEGTCPQTGMDDELCRDPEQAV